LTQCAKCGACTTVCPLYQVTGREYMAARGKIHLLRKLPPAKASAAYAEILSQCLLCGACADACPRGIDPAALIIEARAEMSRSAGKHFFLRHLTRKILASPLLLKGVTSGLPLLQHLPGDSGLRLRLGLDASAEALPAPPPNRPHPEKTAATGTEEVNLFAGCFARYLEPRIIAANQRLLEKIGRSAALPEEQQCCGLAACSAGDLDTAKKVARQNISAFTANSSPILTTCASCYKHLSSYPELFKDDPHWQAQAKRFAGRLLEFSSFFSAQPQLQKFFEGPPPAGPAKKVLYHDPCHLRFGPGVTLPPRQLLALIPSVQLVELPHGPQCCGHGGLFHLGQPELSRQILTRLIDESRLTGAEIVTSTCSGCIMHWRQGLHLLETRTVVVKHLAILLAEALGESADPVRKDS